MQERNNSTAGISVQLWFTRSRSTRLSCTQHEFFAYIHWFSNLYHAFGRSVIIMLCLERQFISQSFCKCDRGLSQESIRNARNFECLVFLFATDHKHKFCSPRICQHEDIWPIRTWYQNLVSWNGGIQTYDQIISHGTPRFMSYYHCRRRWHIMISILQHARNEHRSVRWGWFPNMFRFSSFDFWECWVSLYSLCFKGDFQSYFEGFYMCSLICREFTGVLGRN